MPENRQSSGIGWQDQGARHHFFDGLAGELHIESIRAKFDVFAPSNRSGRRYVDCLEESPILPSLEYPASGKMRQVNLSGGAVRVSEPDPVSLSWLYVSWSNHHLLHSVCDRLPYAKRWSGAGGPCF